MSDNIKGFDISERVDANHLFKPISWNIKLDFINHLIMYNNLMMLVLAERQGGKSSFGAILSQNLDVQICTIVIHARELRHPKDIIKKIEDTLDVNADGDLPMLVKRINHIKQVVMLVIDDAHLLSQQMLSTLLGLIEQQGEAAYFNICLLAEHAIVPKLTALAKLRKTELVHTIELGHLKEKECKSYISYRARALMIPQQQINEALLDKVYKVTAGDLSKINLHLKDFIRLSEHKKKKTGSGKKIATLSSAALALLLVISYFSVPSVKPEMAIATEHTIAAMESTPIQHAKDAGNTGQKAVMRLQAKKPIKLSSYISPLPLNMAQTMVHANAVSPSEAFTIQLISGYSKEGIQNFARQAAKYFSKSDMYIHTQGSFYSLCLGRFDSALQAQSVIKKIPSALSENKPWVRTMPSSTPLSDDNA